jgi:hypothetical protein
MLPVSHTMPTATQCNQCNKHADKEPNIFVTAESPSAIARYKSHQFRFVPERLAFVLSFGSADLQHVPFVRRNKPPPHHI